MKKIEHIDNILADSFGLWISSLFSSIGSWNSSFSFDERKETFFDLIEILLHAGRVKFVAPGADCYVSIDKQNSRYTINDEEAQWNESPEIISKILREQWPAHVSNDEDVDLIAYFYSIPAIIWVAEDGTLVAS